MADQESYKIARKMVDYSLSKKAKEVCLMHIGPLNTLTDYFIICHGESDVQVRAIADAVEEGMEKEGVRLWHKEGYGISRWVLLDYVDVVVHVFEKEVRDFYGLERLWGDADVELFREE